MHYMNRVLIKIISLMVMIAALAMVCCAKVEVNCDYHLKVQTERLKSGDSLIMSSNSRVSWYYADTADWYVASYEDALAGIITSKNDGTTLNAENSENRTDGEYNFVFSSSPVMLVVCDTDEPIFGWRDAGVVPNLPNMAISAVLQPWIRDTSVGNTSPVPQPLRRDTLITKIGWRMYYKSEASENYPWDSGWNGRR